MKADKDYECILKKPAKRRKLTSKTFTITGKLITIEGFDERGPNGIIATAFVPSKK